jgi:hypothetical protein
MNMPLLSDLLRDSDDTGERSNTAPVPPVPRSRKRPREMEGSSSNAHRHGDENIPRSKTTAGSVELGVDLELAGKVEVSSLDSKRHGAVIREPSAKNDGGIQQVMDQEALAIKNLGLLYEAGDWANKFKELSEYRQSKGQCLFRRQDTEYAELSKWVLSQRHQYRRMIIDKDSLMTPERVMTLESIGFVWNVQRITWEDRLKDLADYRKIHRHCNVPQNYSVNPKLGSWVSNQRKQYKMRVEGKQSPMIPFRVQELERLGFEWDCQSAAWEEHWTQLAAYREIQGHCNVPHNYPENTKLGKWVGKQRHYYRLHLEGKKSPMTPFRVQKLERLAFEWDCFGAAWGDRLSELADYREIHGHCNVPQNYNGKCRLANWVDCQRKEYRAYGKGKRSFITLPRIQALERIGFEWEPAIANKKRKMAESIVDHDVTRAREGNVKSRKYEEQASTMKNLAALEESAALELISLSNLMNPTVPAKSTSTSS